MLLFTLRALWRMTRAVEAIPTTILDACNSLSLLMKMAMMCFWGMVGVMDYKIGGLFVLFWLFWGLCSHLIFLGFKFHMCHRCSKITYLLMVLSAVIVCPLFV